jgi:GNAT superfamily N-acetyltransferase
MTGIRPLTSADLPRLADMLRAAWGSTSMASRGRLLDVLALPGFVTENDGQWLGYAAYELSDGALQVVVLESLAPGRGVGSALLARCVAVARERAARRLWLLTTNDNTPALRFYQRRGFALVALHRGSVTRSRRSLKPDIPQLGVDEIPIRDEIELELPHVGWSPLIDRYSWPAG